jgi:hypothetical protein
VCGCAFWGPEARKLLQEADRVVTARCLSSAPKPSDIDIESTMHVCETDRVSVT